MLIILLFAVLLALKLAAIGIVYHIGTWAGILIIAGAIALAYYLEPTAAPRE